MPLVAFHGIYKHFGAHDILSSLSFTIHRGMKVGLIGSNGAGKTTILRLIQKRDQPSKGTIIQQPDMKVGYVPQYAEFAESSTVFDSLMEEVIAKRVALRKAEDLLAVANEKTIDRSMAVYQHARDEYDAINGDDAENRGTKILDSFGLHGRESQLVDTLSGGEKNILSLARATLTPPDLLILDEPGNHLDYIGLAWLERYLVGFPGAVLLVSHNRYLLDRAVTHIYELEKGTITEYEGNYSSYRMTKLQQLVATQADFVANQKKLDRLEQLVKRFEQIARATADPAWGKRLRARRTQLAKEREQAVEKPELSTKTLALELNGKKTKADIALQVNGYSKSFGDNELFQNASLQIGCGQRVALVGPNGSGKTTFLSDVVTKAHWEDAVLRVGPSLTVGYCAQNQEVFDPNKTILEAFADLGINNRKDTNNLLSRFLFSWADLDKRIAGLSGGEMNRLQLARLIAVGADFLILDEPTNHLDIYAREAIEEGLEGFQGTILVVSHDRYFLDKIADTIISIHDHRLKEFRGNFSEFFASHSRAKARLNAEKSRSLAIQRKREGNQDRGVSQSGSRPTNLEIRIEALENQKRVLESSITSLFQAGNHIAGRAESNKLAKVSKRLDDLYGEWDKTLS